MTIHLELIPIVSLAAGIALLVAPRFSRYIIAAYLIFAGLVGLVQ